MRATTISWTLESDSKQRAFNQSTQSVSACVRMYLWTRACRHSTCAAQNMRRAHALNTTPQLSAYKSSMFPTEFFIRKKRYEQNDLLSPSLGQTVRFGETLQRIAIYGNHHFSRRGLWLPPPQHPLPSPRHGPSRLFLVTILADCYHGNRISVIARRQ